MPLRENVHIIRILSRMQFLFQQSPYNDLLLACIIIREILVSFFYHFEIGILDLPCPDSGVKFFRSRQTRIIREYGICNHR